MPKTSETEKPPTVEPVAFVMTMFHSGVIGILKEVEEITRVIIDVDVDRPPRMWIQRRTDHEMTDVSSVLTTPAAGATDA